MKSIYVVKKEIGDGTEVIVGSEITSELAEKERKELLKEDDAAHHFYVEKMGFIDYLKDFVEIERIDLMEAEDEGLDYDSALSQEEFLRALEWVIKNVDELESDDYHLKVIDDMMKENEKMSIDEAKSKLSIDTESPVGICFISGSSKCSDCSRVKSCLRASEDDKDYFRSFPDDVDSMQVKYY